MDLQRKLSVCMIFCRINLRKSLESLGVVIFERDAMFDLVFKFNI